jgi:hypothetical protein
VYLAENATFSGELNPDETEELETILAPLNKLRDYVREGKITCGIMIAALGLYNLYAE